MTYFESILPKQAYPVGYASGFFDLFHVGHLRYLQLAAKHCQKLIVGVPADGVVRADHRPFPVIPCAHRMEIIAALDCVSKVICVEVSMQQPSAFLEFMRKVGNQAIFVGDDWRGSERWNNLGPILNQDGIKVHFLPRTECISSTLIKQKISNTAL